MSTKKDKKNYSDKHYMDIALQLAMSKHGLTGTNPSVGCLIVKDDKIISIGQTGYNGRPHAETNAINNSLQNISGSKMYITLEPCNHYGKTPPCTKNIINNGITEVYYPIDDINKKVKGKSFKILTKKKIKVRRGLLKKEVLDLYDSYIINKKYRLPFVTAKIALSKNKLIYSEKVKRITNQISDKLSHYLRFKNDGLMISSNTLNTDNPKLNCRLKGYEKYSPKRIILDKNLDIGINTYVYKSAKKNNTIIFHCSSNHLKIKSLRRKGINLIKSRLNTEKKFDLKIILKKLFSLGVRNLLVEGGEKMTKNMLKNRLINQFYLFESLKTLPKTKKSVIFTSKDILNEKYIVKSMISSKLAKDKITIYKR